MDSFQQIDRHDSRHSMKERDIAATIARMGEVKKAQEREWERKFGDELTAVTEESVLRGGGDRSILHGGARFRANFENWLKSLKGK
jgi:hypothetical protein